MAQQQQDYGAAQPIYDTAKNAYKKVTGYFNGSAKAAAADKAVDNTYHGDMLSKANESFRKTPVDEAKEGAAQKRVASTGKMATVASKPTTAKSTTRKRVYGK